MQTVLVPTDFSPASLSVLPVAADIARRAKGKIALMHAYGTISISENDREKALTRLKMLFEIYGLADQPHRCFLRNGEFISEIDQLIRQNEVSLVVMCKGGNERERITSKIVQRANIPVLTVPRGKPFPEINKILYLSDSVTMEQSTAIKAVEFASLVNAEILFLCVTYPYTSGNLVEETARFLDQLKFSEPLVSYSFIEGQSLEGALDEYTLNETPDLLIVERVPVLAIGKLDKRELIRVMIHQDDWPVMFFPPGDKINIRTMNGFKESELVHSM